MEIRTGIDIIEVNRIKDAIESLGTPFLNRVFTSDEISYCESKNNMKFQHYSARFAGKEAVFKAISKEVKNKYDITWKDIEIKNDEQGRPYFTVNKIDASNIVSKDISLSHIKDYAIASVSIIIND